VNRGELSQEVYQHERNCLLAVIETLERNAAEFNDKHNTPIILFHPDAVLKPYKNGTLIFYKNLTPLFVSRLAIAPLDGAKH
jgi:hypothetical protein